MSRLEIEFLAPSATIQDGGRIGYRRYGVTKGGAMDPYALKEGQVLLGNRASAAALEMAFIGGKFRSKGDNIVALTGAEMTLEVNGQTAPWRQVLALKDGDQLSVGACMEGCYGYLHLSGGIDSPIMLGSRSAHAQAELGWTPKTGAMLIPLAERQAEADLCLPRPCYFDDRVIRIMAGPQTHLFSKEDVQSLEQATFHLTNARNRIGARIESSMGAINAELGTTIASDAIVNGDIQVAADGIPAVLLADCQPVGGYPKIATVISADLHKFAQLPMGVPFTMKIVSRRFAIGEWERLMSGLNKLSDQVEPAFRDPKEMANLLEYSLIDGVISGDEQNEN